MAARGDDDGRGSTLTFYINAVDSATIIFVLCDVGGEVVVMSCDVCGVKKLRSRAYLKPDKK